MDLKFLFVLYVYFWILGYESSLFSSSVIFSFPPCMPHAPPIYLSYTKLQEIRISASFCLHLSTNPFSLASRKTIFKTKPTWELSTERTQLIFSYNHIRSHTKYFNLNVILCWSLGTSAGRKEELPELCISETYPKLFLSGIQKTYFTDFCTCLFLCFRIISQLKLYLRCH